MNKETKSTSKIIKYLENQINDPTNLLFKTSISCGIAQNKPNRILKAIRTSRKLSMSIFANMLGISTSYLSLLESGKRKIQLQIINKIENVLFDLTLEEKQKLAKIKQSFETLEQEHKKIMKLVSEYIYYLQNKFTDKIEELRKEIIDLINELSKKYGQNYDDFGGLFNQA